MDCAPLWVSIVVDVLAFVAGVAFGWMLAWREVARTIERWWPERRGDR